MTGHRNTSVFEFLNIVVGVADIREVFQWDIHLMDRANRMSTCRSVTRCHDLWQSVLVCLLVCDRLPLPAVIEQCCPGMFTHIYFRQWFIKNNSWHLLILSPIISQQKSNNVCCEIRKLNAGFWFSSLLLISCSSYKSGKREWVLRHAATWPPRNWIRDDLRGEIWQ